jgi:chromosome segregation ATPase
MKMEHVNLANKVLCEENEELKETLEKYSKTITNNLEEIKKLENEKEELNKRIKSLELIVNHRDYCRTNLRERCKKLESEVMDCNDMYYSLLDENKELKSHIEDLELEIAELKKEVEYLKNIIKWGDDMYASLLDENKELKDKIKMFEESDKHKDSTFSDLLVHHDLLIDQNADLKEENSKLLDTLVEKEKYIEKLEHEHAERISTLEKALLDSDRRFNIMADKAKKFDSLLDELEALVDEYNE